MKANDMAQTTTVIILDRDLHQSEFMVQALKEHNIPAQSSTVLEPLLPIPDDDEKRLYLLDYHTMTFEEREAVIRLFKSLNLNSHAIVFNVPPDASKRIVFYELGAFRVFDKSVSIVDVVESVAWWYQWVDARHESPDILMQGQLDKIDFITLLWAIAKRQVNGILEMSMKRNHGEIYFKDGQIIHAQVLTHQGLDALLHLSLWEEGTFRFKPYDTGKLQATIQNTILAISIQVVELKLKLFHLQHQFQSEMSVVQLVNAGDLPLYNLKLDEGFVEFISQPREYGDILENPFYPNHETMLILNQLKKAGLLRINEPIETLIEKELPDFEHIYSDQNQIKKFALDENVLESLTGNLSLKADSPGKIVVISDDEKLLKHYLSSIVGSADRVIFEHNMYLIKFSLGNELEIIFIGILASPQLLKLLSVLSEQINGFIFLINAQNLSKVGYFSYLINQALVQHPIPATCAVTYLNANQSLETIKSQFFLNWDVHWTKFEANDVQSMVQSLESILPVEPIEISEEEGEEE